MNKTARKSKQPLKRERNTYTTEQRDKARKYYLMGLSLSEISKLLDGAPIRTLEKWQKAESWTATKEIQPIKEKAFDMFVGGRPINEIAKTLNIGRVTVWRYCKEVRESRKENTEK